MNDAALHVLAWTFGAVGLVGVLSLIVARYIRHRLNDTGGSGSMYRGVSSSTWEDTGYSHAARPQ